MSSQSDRYIHMGANDSGKTLCPRVSGCGKIGLETGEDQRMKGSFYIKTLLKSILQQIFIVPAAALYYQARLRKKGAFHLIVCSHIGDFLYTMGYAAAFKKAYGIKELRIVSVKKFKDLVPMYPNVECEFVAVPKHWLHILCIADRYVLGRQLFQSWQDNCVIEPANSFQQGFLFAERFAKINLKSCICCGALGLSADSVYEYPEQAHAYVPVSGTGSRKILFCPSAQAVHYGQTAALFGILAKKLQRDGYEIYVNDRSVHLKTDIHVTYVRHSLQEFGRRVLQYQAVIGIRSGILDLAACFGGKVIALYPPEGIRMDFYDFHTKDKERNVYAYQLTGNNKKDAQAVCGYLKK